MSHKLIVIDTNVLLSAALSPNGTAHAIRQGIEE